MGRSRLVSERVDLEDLSCGFAGEVDGAGTMRMADKTQSQGAIKIVRAVEIATSQNDQIAIDSIGAHDFPFPVSEPGLHDDKLRFVLSASTPHHQPNGGNAAALLRGQDLLLPYASKLRQVEDHPRSNSWVVMTEVNYMTKNTRKISFERTSSNIGVTQINARIHMSGAR